jgi:hypothetical protein
MGPRQPTTVAGRSVRRVLAGGEVFGGEEQALHDLQDVLISMVGDVHKKQWWSMAGGEGSRRPWRRAHVPGEGPVNVDEQGVHKHHGDVGCDSSTQFGRRWGGWGSSTVRWTSGSSGEQRHGIASIPAKGSQRLDQSGSEGWQGRRGSSWVLGFGPGGAAAENFSERLGGRLGGRKEEERENKGKERARVGLYRGASLCRREGEREQTRGRA